MRYENRFVNSDSLVKDSINFGMKPNVIEFLEYFHDIILEHISEKDVYKFSEILNMGYNKNTYLDIFTKLYDFYLKEQEWNIDYCQYRLKINQKS